MLRHYPAPILILTLAGPWPSAGCNPRQPNEKATGAVSDTAAATSTESSSLARKVGEVGDLQNPESAHYDKDLNVWFVSNVNGDPSKKDNNGYISRLKADGTPDTTKFIVGGKNGVTLNAPKGIAVVGDTLWVADIDAVRGFNKRNGMPVASVVAPGAKFLNDAAAGPDGTLYITDTGVIPDPKTGLKHVGPDRVYQVKGRKATVALESAQLQGPNGIVWDPKDSRFRDRLVHGARHFRLEAGIQGSPVAGYRPGPAGWSRAAAGRTAAVHQLGRFQPLRAGQRPRDQGGQRHRVTGRHRAQGQNGGRAPADGEQGAVLGAAMSLPRRHGLLLLGPVAVVIVGLGSCGGDSSRRAAESRALAESAAVYEEITNQFRKVGETPESPGAGVGPLR